VAGFSCHSLACHELLVLQNNVCMLNAGSQTCCFVGSELAEPWVCCYDCATSLGCVTNYEHKQCVGFDLHYVQLVLIKKSVINSVVDLKFSEWERVWLSLIVSTDKSIWEFNSFFLPRIGIWNDFWLVRHFHMYHPALCTPFIEDEIWINFWIA